MLRFVVGRSGFAVGVWCFVVGPRKSSYGAPPHSHMPDLKALEDGATLSDASVKSGSCLKLVGKKKPEPMKVCQETPTGKKVCIDAEPSDIIKEVKEKFLTTTGIPVEQQHLSIGGKEVNDEDTLAESGAEDGSTFKIPSPTTSTTTAPGQTTTAPGQTTTSTAIGSQFCVVTPSGKKVMINVQPFDTIKDIKVKVEDKTGIPPDEQQLTFLDKAFEDS